MRERRFLVEDLTSARDVVIGGDEAHHLLHVLRLRPGDPVVLFDGRGRQYHAFLISCEKDRAIARKLEAVPVSESDLESWVAVAVPGHDKMSMIIQKLAELGANRILPLLSERSSVSARARLPRWRRVALEACKQSGRAVLPAVDPPIRFDELLERTDLPSCRLILSPGGEELPGRPRPPVCLVLIGPEGGWSEKEISTAVGRGFHPLGLGPRTLRTETAALAAMAVLQWCWGDLGSNRDLPEPSRQ
jgi:16S rRNA (uracil1498-N3)-methyltransferase